MRAFASRAAATAARTSAIAETTCILIAVLGIGVLARPDVVTITPDGIAHVFSEVRVFLQELRREAFVQAKQIRQYEYLPIAMGSCADSNRWNRDRIGNALRKLGGDQLQHERKCSGILERLCILDHPVRVGPLTSLYTHADCP